MSLYSFCRSVWLIGVGLLCLIVLSSQGVVASDPVDDGVQQTQPNVVWIVSDDLSPDIGCYGGRAVSTPNLDQLAASGFQFESAFATSPICSPSRSAFVTGVYQTTIGAHQHRTRKMKPLPAGVQTVMYHFRQAGYFVCNQGKSDYNFKPSFKFDGKDWGKRKTGQPFFAQIQIREPHRPFHKNKDPDREKQLVLPPYYPDHPVIRADWADYLASIETLDRKVGEVLERLVQEGLMENTIVVFFGDHGRPHVWDKQWLNDGGLRVPLIVKLPNQIKRRLQSTWGEAKGDVCGNLVSLIDLAPTSLALAGLPVPDSMAGRNIFDTNAAPRTAVFGARDRAGDAIDRIRCVRTNQFKYIRNYYPELSYSTRSSYKTLSYPALTVFRVLHQQGKLTAAQARYMADTKPKEELYDLRSDPFEMKNLAGDPQFDEIRNQLSKRLDRWEQETNDMGRHQEMPAGEMKQLMEGKKSFFKKKMAQRGFDVQYAPREYLNWWESELGVSQRK